MTTIRVHAFETPLGTLVCAVRENGALARLAFADAAGVATEGALLAHLAPRFPREEPCVDAGACRDVEEQLAGYFAGERTRFDLELEPRGTPFQEELWAALRQVPHGTTTTYGELAERVGRPRAVRAVGRANATNPIAVVVPCHRVVGAKGALTGYAYGIDCKRALLELEGALNTRSC